MKNKITYKDLGAYAVISTIANILLLIILGGLI